MFCPATLEKLATLFGMMMCALQALDTSWAPVFKEQLADWSSTGVEVCGFSDKTLIVF
jgi:hypothetical protein